ncbi:MAG: Wzz/FepE/Etk N-terminal domain-containing protein [candidate division KSB1 bacterium]|nr:Wzz/FepE/Etk N-terminal domain-containing protein [candidate division KSB1 bacterium]MDZ7368172.1 Wzz/FepE/Etk N-terminal domain-containing protein [candidate division KSB1 bacterium]MDZ7405937.1 Wzz/FepE/Etk N-terminal domain-containing protein [candidate division KSB1 bacterium]
MAQSGGKIDLRRLLQIARRWKWLLIAPPILALAGAYAYVVTTPPLYTSTTTIMLGANQAIIKSITDIAPGTETKRLPKITDIAENIRQQLLAESTLNKVLDRTDLQPSQSIIERAEELARKQSHADKQEIIRKLQLEWLAQKVETALSFPRRGNYIQLSITHVNPDIAYNLTKNLAEVFIEESLLAESVGPRETYVFASKQLEENKQKLEEAREKLRAFKTNMAWSQMRSVGINLQNEAQIGAQIKSVDIEISQKRGQLQSLDHQLGEMRDRIAFQFSSKAGSLRGQMLDKISSVAQLMVQASWRDPQVIKLNQEIATLREELQNEIRASGVGAASNGYSARELDLAVERQMTLMDLELLNRQKSVLEGLVQMYKQSLTQRPSQDLDLAQLQNNVTKLEEIVKTFEDQVRSTKWVEDLRRSDAEVRYNITDPANRPIMPNTADQPKILIMALFGGLGLGVGLVYLIEFFDHSFKSVEDIEQVLGVTVLGTVPKIEFGETDRAKRKAAV